MKTIKYFFLTHFLVLIWGCCNVFSQNQYGNNPEAGKVLDVKESHVYYETYGDKNNQPLILIHGNSGSIAAMVHQIEYFKKEYFVIVGDNRTHGKSGDAKQLTYHLMAGDYISILDDLKLKNAFVLGQSDGGIIGLIMAMDYPNRVSKLISAVPNIQTGDDVIMEWELEFGENYRKLVDSMILANDTSRDWKKEKVHMDLMKKEPNIPFAELKKIKCPVLVMTSDDDIIKPRHILNIYEHIPNAQLFVMPGATHFMIRDEHELFNMMSDRFLSSSFKRPKSKEVLMELIGIN
ncbi:alpha/beta hydrolase [Marinifilum breve]|uniref:Alpha/beta hydrolase n=1 Tax=Marinifilum breve TaxID=2184082 RepID=A0A2V4A6W0_9BACT|nr:alpha/beta hydrolase [Marinifilum breve]PXY03080.1 alpha/beta hydrolase [Marinifilum breve]